MPKAAKAVQLVWGAPHEVITIGPGGWARCNVTEVGEHASAQVFVRVEQDHAGRFFFTEVLVQDAYGVGARTMRDVPLGRMQAALANPSRAEEIAALLHMRGAGPEGAPQHVGDFGFGRRRSRSTEPARLTIPEGRRKPDEFYVDVAVAYAELSGSKQPAADLAAANGVPVTTVHRWVKEARRRGLMAPAHRSEATS